MIIHYDKLVRDRIPDIVARDGKQCEVRALDAAEYARRLHDKLIEELAEYQESPDVEELVDLVEVVQALIEHQGMTWDTFEQRREAKRLERGGFTRRLLLEAVRTDGDETDPDRTDSK